MSEQELKEVFQGIGVLLVCVGVAGLLLWVFGDSDRP